MKSFVDVTSEDTALFSSIGIETASTCNRSCSFCPVSERKRDEDLMSEEMFEKIIDDLRELNYKKRVELYIYNEPTRDERLKDFIKWIRWSLPRACIMINTNGDYFKRPEDIWSYFEAGLTQMQINVYCQQDGRQEDPEKLAEAHKRAAYRQDRLQSWIDSLPLDQSRSLYQYLPSTHRVAKIIRKWGDYTAGIHHISNRSGNCSYKPLLAEPMKSGCTKPFRFLNINWKGDAILCCNDFYGETVAGNVRDRTVKELWNSYVYNIYRLKLQNKDRRIFLCEGCDFDGGPYQHNIQRVTFGKETDGLHLATDLTERKSLFHGQPTDHDAPKFAV